MRIATAAAFLLSSAVFVAAATDCAVTQRVSSGSPTIAIAELYTSEGVQQLPAGRQLVFQLER